MSKPLETTSFESILPPSIAKDETFASAARALDGELKALNGIMDSLFLYADIQSLPEPILKHLAWQWHVDFWEDDLSHEQKAALVSISYRWHQLKGTPGAVEMILEDVLGGGRVEEWWEYGGMEYHFRVISNDPPEDGAAMAVLRAGIEAAKNERSVLDVIIKPASLSGGLNVGGVLAAGCNITIYQES